MFVCVFFREYLRKFMSQRAYSTEESFDDGSDDSYVSDDDDEEDEDDVTSATGEMSDVGDNENDTAL